MLDLNRCKFTNISEKYVATGQTVTAEGAALVSTLENGQEKVKLATGTAGEKFVGFSFSHNFSITQRSKVESLTVPATSPYTLTLEKTNLVPTQILVTVSTGALVEDAAVGSGQYTCNDTTGLLTFHSTEAGEEVTVTYKYYPTAAEIQRDFGDENVNMKSANVFNMISVGEGPGVVYTDQFNASVDWANVTTIYIANNGVLSDSGEVALTGARVVSVPSVDNPFLGIYFK